VGSSTEGAFPRPARETDAEWRLLLTAVAGRLRNVFGEGPANVPSATGVPIMVADNRGKSQPIHVTVQVAVAATVVFGRSANPTIANGIQHNFALETSFEQILMPGDRLFATVIGAGSFFIVSSVLV
jgi:hypothetical protein